jgi:hypothetical protein
MDTDKITTWCGWVKAFCVPSIPFVPPPFNLIPIALTGMAEAIQGYYTNKKD